MKKDPSSMKTISILLADPDSCLAQTVVLILRAMGFASVTHVRSIDEALTALRTQSISFLITEWDIRGGSGLDLVKRLRQDPHSPNRGLPIIMLTGRGEMSDVQTARDVGITEFVVKPFSAQTLYNRLEQIIDHPRSFVISSTYVGPERRRRGLPPPGMADRRTAQPIMVLPNSETMQQSAGDTPMLVAPDYALRQSVATGKPLATIITPRVLAEAQKAIDTMGAESLKWIREDLTAMGLSNDTLQKAYNVAAFDKLKTKALSIKSRSGTFGYRLASDVARLLYLFLSANFQPTNPRHLVVIEKHIEALTVIFAQDIRDREGLGAELYMELERLIAINK